MLDILQSNLSALLLNPLNCPERHQYLLDAIRQRKHFGMACISVVILDAMRWVPRVMLM